MHEDFIDSPRKVAATRIRSNLNVILNAFPFFIFQMTCQWEIQCFSFENRVCWIWQKRYSEKSLLIVLVSTKTMMDMFTFTQILNCRCKNDSVCVFTNNILTFICLICIVFMIITSLTVKGLQNMVAQLFFLF